MKLLILFAVLAVASAGYPWAQHYPVVGPSGHLLETPEVQAAKSHHFAAHAEALARSGHGLVLPVVPYAQVHGLPAIAHNGQPLDTPEVAIAKAQHHHDYAVAAQRNGVHVLSHGHLAAVPLDTPEVQLAKAAHFAAHAQAAHGLVHYRKRRSILAYAQHIPLIGHGGVPVETPEVQAAKAHHFAAHAEASARSGHLAVIPQVYAAAYPQHVPLIAHNGVPLDTPEVQLAKAHHFAAHAQAASQSGHYSPVVYAAPWIHGGGAIIDHTGHPVETPEVQHAKAAHFAAHAAALHY